MDTCTCMAESLHCSPETITTLLIGYIPIENQKKLKIAFPKNFRDKIVNGHSHSVFVFYIPILVFCVHPQAFIIVSCQKSTQDVSSPSTSQETSGLHRLCISNI